MIRDVGAGEERLVRDRVRILHLRMSSAGGGGPEKTLLRSGCLIDHERFDCRVGYLRRRDRDVSAILARGRAAGLDYREFPGRLFIDVGQLREILRCIRDQDTQILHCHDPKTDVYGLLLRRQCPGLRLVSTMHGWPWRTSLRRAFSNRLDLWALSRFDATLAVSAAVREIALRHGVRHARLVHNAIDAEEWDPARPGRELPGLREEGCFMVGFVGRLSKEKSPRDFVLTARAIAAQDTACRFVVVGEGAERAGAQALASSLGLDDRIRFVGSVSHHEMPSLYRALDVLLLTSRTEGLPNTVLEALAMKVPVVATEVGGVGEIVTHERSGLLAAAGDVDSLARYVLAVKGDLELAERLRTGGRTVVQQRFSFRQRIREIEAIYAGLVAEG